MRSIDMFKYYCIYVYFVNIDLETVKPCHGNNELRKTFKSNLGDTLLKSKDEFLVGSNV